MDGSQTRYALTQMLTGLVNREKLKRGEYLEVDAERDIAGMLDELLEMAGGHCLIDERALHGVCEAGRQLVSEQRRVSEQPLLSIQALALYMERSGYKPNFRLALKEGAR